ncbi:cysteine desulfurase [Friedmanniella luteola]|uniref:Cysteine desulfurase n=1 Tax=Friedmanniella luteola TaxID=546871 RepID=A0A1H1NY82_9ACTN|nr:aminotransferase class V-fold PLP-dependent enzyme [Friedmanniella luteola]SDS03903.1 cysteine desulfurase [Friedmanniella luteola]
MAEPVTEVFWDASTAEPVLPEAQQAWLAAQASGWGDPGQLHRPGRLAAQALDAARQTVADALGARPDEVVFPASGVHAAHAAVAGLARGRRRVGEVVVTSTIDHSSVLSAADAAGRRVGVPVDRYGHLDLERWRAAVAAPGVALACLAVANHEVGTRQPVDAAAEACAAAGVPLVLDVSTALGRLDLRHLPAGTVLTAGAQAFGGPPSVGVLVLRKGARWRAPYLTDDHQAGRWPGPPDVPAIHAAAAALEVWLRSGRAVGDRQRGLVDRLRAGVLAGVPDVEVAGDPVDRVPHLLTFSALYVDGETLTLELDRAGFAVTSGSACSANSEHPSHVLAAMGLLTHGNVRIGLTRRSTAGQVEAFLAVLPDVVARIRATLGAPGSPR